MKIFWSIQLHVGHAVSDLLQYPLNLLLAYPKLLLLQGWTNLLLRARFFGCAIYLRTRSSTQKNGHEKSKSMCTSDRGTTRNIHSCSLLPDFIVIPSNGFPMSLMQCEWNHLEKIIFLDSHSVEQTRLCFYFKQYPRIFLKSKHFTIFL